MKTIEERQFNKEVYNFLLSKGTDDMTAKIMSSRLSEEDSKLFVNNTLDSFMDYKLLKNIKESAELCYKHMKDNKLILLVTDYDLDGCTSASVLYRMFKECFNYHNIEVIINKRSYGNGINDTLTEQILELHKETTVSLIITADHGSSSEESIAVIRNKNIDFLLTDHHLIPEDNFPKSANVIVNPQLKDCSYDKCISGCCVAYLTMLNLEDFLETKKWNLKDRTLRDTLLPTVAISTIGDSMKLSSRTNRYIVKKGFKIMNLRKDPVWQAFYNLNTILYNISEKDLGFKLNPLLNAASRINDPIIAFNYLTSKDFKEAQVNFKIIDKNNTKRKEIQSELMKEAKRNLIVTKEMKFSTVPVIANGLGLNGVISSMLGEQHGKPIVTFTNNKDNTLLMGSGRGIINVNMREAYENIAKQHSNMITQYGGHKGAAGITIKSSFIDSFKDLFDKQIENQLKGKEPVKIIEYDYELEPDMIHIGLAKHLEKLGPFGMDFPAPIFKSKLKVLNCFAVGKGKEHLSFKISLDRNIILEAFWPYGNANGDYTGINLSNKYCDFYFTVNLSFKKGNYVLDMGIKHLVH